jgi:ADP-heptose:LPS heptosyltransferase
MDSRSKILVIKLGALGDFIQAFGPMAAIRSHHPEAHITLLTTTPFENFAEQSKYFNDIWIDERPKFFNIKGWRALKNKLNAGKFTRVYDLQNNNRTAFYLKLFSQKPEWVGAAPGASHRNNSAQRRAGHAFDGHMQTLALAGIKDVRIDTLDWMDANITYFPLKKPYVLLAPGSAPQHPHKRWPAQHYGRLAQILAQSGYQPIILGSAVENEIASAILQACPESLNLAGQTSLPQIAALARGAAGAIGNDTGPMHLIAATSCPCIALFSGFSDKIKHAPRGADVQILQQQDIGSILPEEITQMFRPRAETTQRSVTFH